MKKTNQILSDGQVTVTGMNIIKSFVSRFSNRQPINIATNATITNEDISKHLAYSEILQTLHHNSVTNYENIVHHMAKLEQVTVDEVVSTINRLIQEMIKPQKCVILVDFTNDPYYGKDKRFAKGVKRQQGTSFAHQYLSFMLMGEKQKGYVAFVPITQFTDVHKKILTVVKQLCDRYEVLGFLADREFFNTDDLNTFNKFAPFYLTPATRNKGVKDKEEMMKRGRYLFSLDTKYGQYLREDFVAEELKEIFEKTGLFIVDEAQLFKEKQDEWVVSVDGREVYWIEKTDEELKVYGEGKRVAKHRMGVSKEKPVVFNMIRVWKEECRKHYLFATPLNIPQESVERFIETYRSRWNIETGFKDRNVFRIRTTSNKYSWRVLFFGASLFLYNIWQVLKSRDGLRKIDLCLIVLKYLFCSKCPSCPSESIRNEKFYDIIIEPS